MADHDLKVKVPPNSKEAEMMVLGCMLTSINALNIAADKLHEIDFYFNEHKIVFNALKTAYQCDKPADIHIICEELKRLGELQAAGGAAYLTTLAQFAGTSAYIEEYCNIVHSKSVLRRIINASHVIEKKALKEPEDVEQVLDEAQQILYDIGKSASSGESIFLKDIITGVKSDSGIHYLKELEARQEKYRERGDNDPGITGVPTHLTDFDKMINGLNNSNLMILAARPAMGKTALAINIAENVCFKNNMAVGVFSLEMSAEQLVHRLICSQAEVESDKIKTGSLDGDDYQRIVKTINEIQHHPFIIDDQPGISVTDLRARARRMKESYNIGFLVIDYLQLLSGSGQYKASENRQLEISEISRNLKNLARELNIPILCLSQLSRKVEERPGHRPMMSDLRESGSIEQDSDLVMFLLRREYYDPMDKPGLAELIIAKNRHGSIGTVNLTFRKEIAQFANYTPLGSEDAPYGMDSQEPNESYARF
jgi:replicative DNA helicase